MRACARRCFRSTICRKRSVSSGMQAVRVCRDRGVIASIPKRLAAPLDLQPCSWTLPVRFSFQLANPPGNEQFRGSSCRLAEVWTIIAEAIQLLSALSDAVVMPFEDTPTGRRNTRLLRDDADDSVDQRIVTVAERI